MHTGDNTVDPKTSQVIMVDIGGTTSDFAALSPSGFPRQSPATVKVGGVRTAFSLPELLSIGLGGGSHVHQHEDGRVTVGPTSVGHKLPELGICFGGEVLTATDIVVAGGTSSETVGSTSVDLPADVIEKARRYIKRQLERHIDDMRASDQDVVLLLVGGGSIIQMDEIQNVKACIRPPFYDVANAVGAAVAKVIKAGN
jgi:N-methylhydantoinase A/oxoprolinase/acetone carboxylase beta subunit